MFEKGASRPQTSRAADWAAAGPPARTAVTVMGGADGAAAAVAAVWGPTSSLRCVDSLTPHFKNLWSPNDSVLFNAVS